MHRICRVVHAGSLMLLVTATLHAQTPAPARLGAPASDFRAYTLDSAPALRTLADYRGKVVLLAIWATWCRDCRDEMASMQRMYARYASQGFRVVAVSIDKPNFLNKVRDFVRENGLTFDVLSDASGSILTAYLTVGVPSAFLIDRDGVIRRRVVAGVDWDVAPRRDQIIALLGEGHR